MKANALRPRQHFEWSKCSLISSNAYPVISRNGSKAIEQETYTKQKPKKRVKRSLDFI